MSTNPDILVKIKGDYSLNKRNMRKLVDLMSEFGATFLPKNKSNFPLTLMSSEIPIGIEYKAGISAQLKSAAIFAGLNANGVTNIIEEKKSRNHTENMLLQSSNVLKIKKNNKGQLHIVCLHSSPIFNSDATRKLLLNKRELRKLNKEIKNVGLTIVPFIKKIF